MRIIELPRRDIAAHGSVGVAMDFLPRVHDGDRSHVHIAHIDAGGLIGVHPAPVAQVLTLISGRAQVTVEGQHPRQLVAGHAVIWQPGEVHETHAETAVVAVIVESTGRFVLDEHFPEVAP